MSNNILEQIIAAKTEEARANVYKNQLAYFIDIIDNSIQSACNEFPWFKPDNLIVDLTEDAKKFAQQIATLIIQQGMQAGEKISADLHRQLDNQQKGE
jgi:hypothetical protein